MDKLLNNKEQEVISSSISEIGKALANLQKYELISAEAADEIYDLISTHLR